MVGTDGNLWFLLVNNNMLLLFLFARLGWVRPLFLSSFVGGLAALVGGFAARELWGQAPHQEDMPVRNRQPLVLSNFR